MKLTDRRLRKLPIARVTPLLPLGSKVIADVPVESFTDPAVGVYQQFYRWLVKEHGLTEPGHDGLHDRIFVGCLLSDRLDALERERIGRLHPGATKERIDRAIAWSSGDAGPHGCVQSTKGFYVFFDGDACFVVPPSKPGAVSADRWKTALADSYSPGR